MDSPRPKRSNTRRFHGTAGPNSRQGESDARSDHISLQLGDPGSAVRVPSGLSAGSRLHRSCNLSELTSITPCGSNGTLPILTKCRRFRASLRLRHGPGRTLGRQPSLGDSPSSEPGKPVRRRHTALSRTSSRLVVRPPRRPRQHGLRPSQRPHARPRFRSVHGRLRLASQFGNRRLRRRVRWWFERRWRRWRRRWRR